MMQSDLPDTERFRCAIARSLGLQFDETKSDFLSEQLRARAQANGESNDAYLDRWTGHVPAGELRALAPKLTVAETYFFRNEAQFRVLRELALHECGRALRGSRPLRILSAGCATGEEPYSIAIAARETLGPCAREISVRGVDLNPLVLEQARKASYGNWALRDTSAAVRDKWFHDAANGRWALNRDVQDAVVFEEANLMDESAALWSSGPYDIIFCRNVLMYFEPRGMQAIVQRFARLLSARGFLFLGHAETLRGVSDDFLLCHTHDTFYYRLKDESQTGPTSGVAMPLPWSTGSTIAFEDAAKGPSARAAADETWAETIHRAAQRIRTLTPSVPRRASAVTAQADRLAETFDLLRQERYLEALALIKTVPLESACDPSARVLRAVLLTHSLQLPEAEAACRQLLDDDVLGSGAHYLLALCRESAGDLPAAREHDQYAIYLDPSFAMPRMHLGMLSRRAGNIPLARRELAHAHILLEGEDAARLLLFGGGFKRETLMSLCQAELKACGAPA